MAALLPPASGYLTPAPLAPITEHHLQGSQPPEPLPSTLTPRSGAVQATYAVYH